MAELFWLRSETKENEHRRPLVPSDCQRLIGQGHEIVVEDWADSIIPIEAYRDAGCEVQPAGSWMTEAPKNAIVTGLKALPPAAPARSMDWQKWGRGRPGRRVDAGEQASRASRLEAARSKTLKTGSDSSRPRPCRRHNSSQPPRDRHDERGLDRARLRGRAPGAPNAGSTGPASRPGAGSAAAPRWRAP